MKYASLSAVLLVLAPAALAGQDMAQKAPKPTATSTRAVEGVGFELPVKGLSADNAKKVQAALTAMTVTEYVCPHCGTVQMRTGKCTKCEVALEPKTETVFGEARTSPEKGSIALVLEPSAHVRLSAIEGILRSDSISVPRDGIHVGHGILVYTGASTSDEATQLQKAFQDAKLASAKATFEPSSKEVHVDVGEASLTWARAAELGKKLTKPLRLNDIDWGGLHAPRG